MADGTATHIRGTAKAACKGAGGRFVSRTIDVDLTIDGSLSESEAMAAGAADAMARIGEQCYSFSWLSFAYETITSEVVGELNVRAHVYFRCYGTGEDKTVQVEYVDNLPGTLKKDDVERIIRNWGLEQQYKAEAGFGPGDVVQGCVYVGHEVISPLYWPMSGGI